MMARDYAPASPINRAPAGPYVPPAEREDAVRDALDGVELGDYDHRIIEWLARWDDSTVRTVVSLILRAREAGPR